MFYFPKRLILIFLLLVTNLNASCLLKDFKPTVLAHESSPTEVPKKVNRKTDLEFLDSIVTKILSVLNKYYPENNVRIYAAGGFARFILDVKYRQGTGFSDADFFVPLPEQPSEEKLQAMVTDLELSGVGKANDYFSNLLRSTAERPELHSHGQAIGFVNESLGEVVKVDVGFMIPGSEMYAHGITSIETIQVGFDQEMGLLDFIENDLSYEAAVLQERVLDHFNSYIPWTRGEIFLVEKGDDYAPWKSAMIDDPWGVMIRHIRTFVGKTGNINGVPEKLSVEIEMAVSNGGPKTDTAQKRVYRHLLSLLEDPNAAIELKALERHGIAKAWSPHFHELIASKSLEQWKDLFKTAKADERSKRLAFIGLGRANLLSELSKGEILELENLIKYDTGE